MRNDLGLEERLAQTTRAAEAATDQAEILLKAALRHAERLGSDQTVAARRLIEGARGFAEDRRKSGPDLFSDALDYARDAWQRWVLTLETLRQRGTNDAAHEAAGTPPVLDYASDLIMDGRALKRPVNYILLKILPPEGIEVLDWKRPYLIIDPRAGHGAGIGGFKPDSQVGVALRDGHPVYFVAFRPHPEPGQTLADVTRAEAEFVREIERRHPKSAKPVIVGNCQGGWAAMLLAAAHPDITGPVVINGAPLAYWSGKVGHNPMRYNGGLLGGLAPALLLSDLGAGEFDGAHLVANFEQLNPSRNFLTKYTDLYRNIDHGRERFLEFERWWGGFHFMNEAEIHWIVEQLFIGNRLARGEARIERGRQLDLKAIRSPIIVFASHGDNITPPQQALNWILDTYADENEIRVRGQRIVYMVHDKVGHLGIFVSSGIARKEHAEVTSTLKTIEALAPGLYEMVIEDEHEIGADRRFTVSFQERRFADILALDEATRGDETAFAAVDRLSQFGAEWYDLFVRPFVKAAVTPEMARLGRDCHPARMQRAVFSDRNPFLAWLAPMAEAVEQDRRPAASGNSFASAETLAFDAGARVLDLYRDIRDAGYELAFYSIFASPMMESIGRSANFQRTRKDPKDLRFLPEVQAALLNVERGGFVEAVIRMLIVLADARGSVRRSRLERSAKVLTQDKPFAELGPERRAAIIHEQALIVEFEREAAIEAIAKLLPSQKDRQRAIAVVDFIAGPLDDMDPQTIKALQGFRRLLALPPLAGPGESDPLTIADPGPQRGGAPAAA